MRYRHLVTGLIVTTERNLDWPYELLDVPDDPEPTTYTADSEESSISYVGGGWYEVRRQDGVTERVQGRTAAEALT